MRGLNRIILTGNLGGEPKMTLLAGNNRVLKCAIATTEIFRNKDGTNRAITEWHTVLFWNTLADVAQAYLRKGQLILVEGRIRYREYEDRQMRRCRVTEIFAERFIMLN